MSLRHLCRWCALLVLAALSSAPAVAQQDSPKTERVQVGGREIAIPAPFQYCDLDAAEPRDKLLIDALDRLAGDRRVLRRMAPCEELKTWRKDKDAEPVEVMQMLHDPAAGYHDLGPGHVDERNRQAVQRRLVRRLEGPGYRVSLAPPTPAA